MLNIFAALVAPVLYQPLIIFVDKGGEDVSFRCCKKRSFCDSGLANKRAATMTFHAEGKRL